MKLPNEHKFDKIERRKRKKGVVASESTFSEFVSWTFTILTCVITIVICQYYLIHLSISDTPSREICLKLVKFYCCEEDEGKFNDNNLRFNLRLDSMNP